MVKIILKKIFLRQVLTPINFPINYACFDQYNLINNMLETQDLIDFAINKWYKQFEEVTLKSVIVNIPSDVISNLRSNKSDLEILEECSRDYICQLKNIILSLEGSAAFIKNNWHAPIDAKFINNELKVTNVGDLFLYLTASEIISNDFANDKFDEFVIVLRPWINIHPASEFRCVVINNVLQGITPRDWPTFYAHFSEDGPNIINLLGKFYQENVKGKFNRKNYIYDVVINYPENIVLLDFGPLNNKTNLYAFSWKEIKAIVRKDSSDEVPPVFRYLEKDMGIMTKAEALFKIQQSEIG